MLWDTPIVDLLVTDDCRAKALVRYELTQLECRLRRRSSFNAFDQNLKEVTVHTPIKLVLGQGDDVTLLAWLDKMFKAFQIDEWKGVDVAFEGPLKCDSATKINQLFKAISEAQTASTSYHKKG